MVQATFSTRPARQDLPADSGPATPDLLHRARAEDAFAVNWARTGKDRFSVQVRWPQGHAFFTPVDNGRHDPLLVAETLRQSVMLVLHAGYGVPQDHALLLTNLAYRCTPRHLVADEASTAITTHADCRGFDRRRRSMPSRITLVLSRAGEAVAEGAIDFQIASPQVYRRVRGGRTTAFSAKPTTPPIPARLAGRTRVDDVLLSPASHPLLWQLRVDTGHTTLFQSPKDHIPGMLLLEAARQAANAALPQRSFAPWEADTAFHSYAESDGPCWIRADVLADGTPAGATTVRVTGHQDDRLVFVTTLRDDSSSIAGS